MTLQLDTNVTADMTDIEVRAVLNQIFASTEVEVNPAGYVSFKGPTREYWQLDPELMRYVDTLDTEQDPRQFHRCLLYTSPSPRDGLLSRMPSSA